MPASRGHFSFGAISCMNDEQLLRYSRHILLDDIGIEGQRKLIDAHALVVGAGGLGSPVALYLATAGVGTLTIVDDDQVDLTNLQRQIAHRQSRLGMDKAESIAASVAEINPEVRVRSMVARVDAESLDSLVAAADVVLDCSDNFATRHAINAACVKHAKPLVAGAAIGFDAQISVYDTRRADAPCYSCVFPPGSDNPDVRCATMGVLAPLVGIIGSMQAVEALKLLTGVGESLAGRLQMLDARRMDWSEIRVPRDIDCPVCGGGRDRVDPMSPERG